MLPAQQAIGSWINNNTEAAIALVMLVVTILGYAGNLWLKRIAYRVHLDAPIGVTPREAPDIDLIEVEPRDKGRLVPDPAFALVRITNSGSREIHESDLTSSLVLLSGVATEKPAVVCRNFPRGGRIIRDTTKGNGRSLVLGGLALVVVSASTTVLLADGAGGLVGKCAEGTLEVAGSSAFADVTNTIGPQHESDCYRSGSSSTPTAAARTTDRSAASSPT
ncbi:hypothetical protein V5P93_004905 [Actinokineospora auranticolor]|uniref:Uncharacterized protein n=1 Tax=Actinokineospora auranticolor TaxID=155976 RepID=A0A2S6GNS9_9PSEU|nr:hypothetical protein [Actinokineospora auranticolor]PPK66867.1 hypothetical protein CLV40_109252 [Actinokineospora auranticolor]